MRRMTPTNQAGQASIIPAPSGEEAAAIVAAVEMFMRATALPPAGLAEEGPEGWQRAAILEGIERSPWADVPDPWINT
jgi:hypothetical protein